MTVPAAAEPADPEAHPRPRCPAPADFREEVAAYDRNADVARWDGPRYRMTYRVLGEGPPLIVCPGIAATYRVYTLALNRLAGRFRTIVYDYPGDLHDDGARLIEIRHEHLVDDVFGLIDHLNIGRAFLFAPSFGSTVALRVLRREPRRFPKAVLQGAFAHRRFSAAERLGLKLGRRVPGTVDRLPLRNTILSYNSRCHFPDVIADRWPYYLEQNGLTPIAALAHRVDLLTGLDLRPILRDIPNEVLLLQGNEDRIVPRAAYEALLAGLPNAQGAIMPLVGHQPHFTHGEALAQTMADYLLPCSPTGCPKEAEAAATAAGDVRSAAV